ncbi:lamin tail domain-containing protein, partial [Verrucomicrobia bacterium]|nr:lamin tail domain-containing protein [Verrucomicrobiota bacterium]
MKHITTIIAPEHDSKTKHMMKLTAVLTLMLLCGLQSTTGQVRISEFSAFNSSTLADEEGSQEDWIELVNLGSQTINLNAWNLTDDAQSLRKWTFPSVLLSPGNYLVIFASGKDRRASDRPLHTNFKLSADGEFLALVNPDLEIVSNAFSPSYPQQFRDVSFGFGLEQSTTVLVASTDSGRINVP